MYIFLFLFLVFIVISGLSIVGFIVRSIFGLGRGSSSRTKRTDQGQGDRQQRHSGYRTGNRADPGEEAFAENTPGTKHQKIFTREDGEYVDFEEIK